MKQLSRRAMPVLIAVLVTALGCRARSDSPILEEYFGTPDSAWAAYSDGQAAHGYADGAFFIETSKPHWFTWVTAPRRYGDTRVQIDVELASGPSDGHAGIICRLQDDGAFYYLAISSDGYYGIFRRVDAGALEAINSARAMVFAPAIRTGEGPNRLVAICDGDQITLMANGETLETVVDGTYRKGRIGFGAGSGSGGTVRLRFDDLAIYAQ
jgi:hypothetical protein